MNATTQATTTKQDTWEVLMPLFDGSRTFRTTGTTCDIGANFRDTSKATFRNDRTGQCLRFVAGKLVPVNHTR